MKVTLLRSNEYGTVKLFCQLNSIGAWSERQSGKVVESNNNTLYSFEKINNKSPTSILNSASNCSLIVSTYIEKFFATSK